MTRLYTFGFISSILLLVRCLPADDITVHDISVNGFAIDSDPAISVDGISMVSGQDVHVNGLSTVTDIPDPAIGFASTFTVTVTISGTPTLSVETITLYPPATPTITLVAATGSPANEEPTADAIGTTRSGSHSGAIAGGVVGAVLVAVVAALLFLRFRGKHSPKHWRNRPEWRWQNADAKTASHSVPQQMYVGDLYDRPYDGSTKSPLSPNPVTPVAPSFVREKHRPSASYPFSDPHSSPQGGSTRGHRRNQSSFGSFGGGSHYRDDSIEMGASSPGREEFLPQIQAKKSLEDMVPKHYMSSKEGHF